MTARPLQVIQLDGVWHRLHRADSSALTALLGAEEMAAVRRRLQRQFPMASGDQMAWIPLSSGPTGGRFAVPNSLGALYLGDELPTCAAEVEFHHARICRESGAPAGARATFRHLVFQIEGRFADASAERIKGLHSPTDYAPSWVYGLNARLAALDGVHYRSVRRKGGSCAAAFQESALHFIRVEFGAVLLEWDGEQSRRIA